jgi:hypothetical protein
MTETPIWFCRAVEVAKPAGADANAAIDAARHPVSSTKKPGAAAAAPGLRRLEIRLPQT